MSELDNKLKKIIKEVRGLHATDPRLMRGDLITHMQYLKGLGFTIIEKEELAFLFKMIWEPKCYWEPQDHERLEKLREAHPL